MFKKLLYAFLNLSIFAKNISIIENKFYINNQILNKGNPQSEGFFVSIYCINGIIDGNFQKDYTYSDTGNDFISNLELWSSYGLNGFTLGLQGNIKKGYKNVGTFDDRGNLKVDYLNKLKKILEESNRLNFILVLSLFNRQYLPTNYETFEKACKNILEWLKINDYHNLIIEPVNNCDKEPLDKFSNCYHTNYTNILNIFRNESFIVGSGTINIPLDILIKNVDVILINGVYNQGFVNAVKACEFYTSQPIVYYKSKVIMIEFYLKMGVSYGFYDKELENLPIYWNSLGDRERIFFDDLQKIL